MARTLAIFALALLGGIQLSGQSVSRSALHDYRVVTYVDALVQPWSIAFLPGGDTLITERPGRLRIVRNGKLLPQRRRGRARSRPQQSGRAARSGAASELRRQPAALPDLFEEDREPADPQEPVPATTALIRGRFENDRLTNVAAAVPIGVAGRGHFGGKIAFDKNGFVFLTLGDRQVPPEGNLEAHPAQDLTNHHGKMIRLHDDGRVPADNPFVKHAEREARDLELRSSQRSGAGDSSRDRRRVGQRTRTAGRRRAEPDQPMVNYGWPVDWLRRELPDRPRHSRRHAPRGHAAAARTCGCRRSASRA